MKRKAYWDKHAKRLRVDAEKYYTTYSGMSMLQSFEKLLPFNFSGAKIIDVGCGAGRYFKYLKAKGASLLVAVDTGERLLLMCKEDNPFGEAILADAQNLPFKDESFDVVISMGLIEHFEQPDIMLKEVVRILRHEGILILETPNYLNPFHTFYKLKHRRQLLWEHWWGPWNLINLVKRNPDLRFEKFTSSIIFPGQSMIIVSIGSRLYNKIPALIANLEHALPLEYFGHLMFVSAKRLK